MTPEFQDLMLITATGGSKAKRLMGTETGITTESTNCMMVTNGIEPVSRHEIINRTLVIDLSIEKYGRAHFNELRVMDQVMAARPAIMSGCLKLLRKHVLPRVESGDVSRIARELPSHPLDRFNQYIALMAAVLDAVFAFAPSVNFSTSRKLVNRWVEVQAKSGVAKRQETSDIVYFLDLLAERHADVIGVKAHPVTRDGAIEMRTSTRSLLTDFRLMARHVGMRCPWQNESQLGTRLLDARKILADAGWAHVKVKVNGRTINKFKRMEGGRVKWPQRSTTSR